MDASPTTAPAPDAVLGAAGARVPFRWRGRDITCADALQSLALRGAWAEVVDEVGRGEHALAAADEEARAELESRLPVAETALRRHLRLTAADDYVAWLGRRGLTVEDCRDHLRRRLARDGAAEVPSAPVTASRAAVHAHVVLEGVLDGAVRRLAQDAALADVDPASGTWLDEVVAGAARERGREPDPDAVEQLVHEHSVDWTRVDATVVVVPDDDVARELVLCVRDKRASLASVAADVGIPAMWLSTTMDSVEPWLEPVLVGAEPGALVGPLAHRGGRAVVELQARTPPSAQDDGTWRLAADLLLERRAAVAISATVRWSDDA